MNNRKQVKDLPGVTAVERSAYSLPPDVARKVSELAEALSSRLGSDANAAAQAREKRISSITDSKLQNSVRDALSRAGSR